MRNQILNKSNTQIYMMDFSNMKSMDEITPVIEKGIQYIRSQPKESVLTLTNVEGMHFNNEIKDAFTTFVNENKPFVKQGAVVGMNGLIRILYNGMLKITGRNLRAFNAKDEAIQYLVSNN